jgi:hypothetical protein
MAPRSLVLLAFAFLASSPEPMRAPRFLGNPSPPCRALFRPRWSVPAWVDDFHVLPGTFCLPLEKRRRPPQLSFRGSMTRPTGLLSTLRSHGHPSLLYDHARLALRLGDPRPAGRDFHPRAALQSFIRYSFLSDQASPGALLWDARLTSAFVSRFRLSKVSVWCVPRSKCLSFSMLEVVRANFARSKAMVPQLRQNRPALRAAEAPSTRMHL